MQVLKDEVRKNIRDAAIKTFKEYGYQKASMRNIAEDAGMSVGNLYRYYKNKEDLFGELVKPMITFFEKNRQSNSGKMDLEMLDVNMLEHSVFIEHLMEARMDFKDELHILFLCAEGSPYAGARDAFRDSMEENAALFLEDKGLAHGDIHKSKTFIKAVAGSLVEAFCINLEQSETEEEFLMNTLRYMEIIVKPAIRNLIAIRDNTTSFRRISDEEIIRRFNSHRHHSHCSSAEGTEHAGENSRS